MKAFVTLKVRFSFQSHQNHSLIFNKKLELQGFMCVFLNVRVV